MRWYQGRRLPRWLGALAHWIGFPAVHGLGPWALSLFGVRHGWVAGHLGLWNSIGLIPVAAGFFVEFLCMREHIAAAPQGWLFEKTTHFPTPSYLLTQGPYRYSCNPIYLAEAVIWLGWTVFFGSFVLAAITGLGLALGSLVVVPQEEKGLEARFGDAYREYRRTTPHWLGTARR